jgi:hypothetical protein
MKDHEAVLNSALYDLDYLWENKVEFIKAPFHRDVQVAESLLDGHYERLARLGLFRYSRLGGLIKGARAPNMRMPRAIQICRTWRMHFAWQLANALGWGTSNTAADSTARFITNPAAKENDHE